MISKQVEALLQDAVKAAAPLRLTDLLHIDEKSIRAAYERVDEWKGPPDFTYDDFRAGWICSTAEELAEALIEVAPHLEYISRFHAKPEVKFLVRALEELIYRDGMGGRSTSKYEQFLDPHMKSPVTMVRKPSQGDLIRLGRSSN